MMIDGQALELLATGYSLVADFLKVRQERGESCDAAAFHEWLRSEAVPRLLEQSAQTFQTVVSMKATQTERYDELLAHVLAIRRALSGPTTADVWSQLSDLDQRLLRIVYEKAREEPFEHSDCTELTESLHQDSRSIAKSARYLSERGLLKLAEYSGGQSVAPQAEGVCLAWAIANPLEHSDGIRRLTAALPLDEATDRLETLAVQAQLPIGLVYFVVSEWAREGHMTFEDDATPWEGGLIYNVSESFLRSSGLDLGGRARGHVDG
jgi:hypothetical protein